MRLVLRLGLAPSLVKASTAQPARCLSGTRPCRGRFDDKAKQLHQQSLNQEEQQVKIRRNQIRRNQIRRNQIRRNQIRRPWLRDGADRPPVEADAHARPQSEASAAQGKGKLLTTPTRLLKLILPLPVRVAKDDADEAMQPLALLVHPQQPLSYVERLIQAELPPVFDDEHGKEKVPRLYFKQQAGPPSDSHGHGAAPFGREGPDAEQVENWVRWSSSTEVGDFIRDAARGREFAIEVEGHGASVRVDVPSFQDRTYYMRLRLRKMGREMAALSSIKDECNKLAHRAARRLAQSGFVALSAWWLAVYYLTFMTEWGWDLVEPVTYLVGLTTIMAGYLWFLFINRDLSYRAAMNMTVSRRQQVLYDAKGFDPHRWQQLVDEANGLRREIRSVASEYDVDWDEAKDVGEEVAEVMEKERSMRRRKKKRKRSNSSRSSTRDDDDDDDEDDEDPDVAEDRAARNEGKKDEKKDRSTG
ncbi:hypothetical protein P8C59_008415 [Phyllachora maydis]|uniref:Calcium uniporter protein n=1 Tax=Phyllachora maydis TaxID=1825666 RepID=A0AAD9MJQ0_9PEZI|nr:hypothetical protein P8C59_008415 [Phyllachora maydis]